MRNINDNIVTEAGTNGSYPMEFVEIIVDPNVAAQQLRISTGFKDVTFDSNTYTPAGSLLGISAITVTKDVQTTPITIQLSAIPDSVVAALNTEPVLGSQVNIYRGYWSDATNALIADPYLRWSGIITSHSASIDDHGESTITVTCKNLMDALLSNKFGRFTSDVSFKEHNSTDRSMEFVASVADFNPRFGAD